MTKVVLVKAWKGNSRGLPKGKINQGEPSIAAAVREASRLTFDVLIWFPAGLVGRLIGSNRLSGTGASWHVVFFAALNYDVYVRGMILMYSRRVMRFFVFWFCLNERGIFFVCPTPCSWYLRSLHRACTVRGFVLFAGRFCVILGGVVFPLLCFFARRKMCREVLLF